MKGTVKKKMEQGYGFITPEGETKDLFFHSNDLNGITFDEIQEGDSVTFEVVNGEKGKSAKNVTRV
jgi:CspA family cold shock protein